MPAYIYGDILVTDPVLYDEYRPHVPAIVARYGGKYLVRGGAVEVLEGETTERRQVLIEFPDAEQAKRFYDSPEYKEIRGLRQRASDSRLCIIHGV
jgi:uncharacterized protein (DUF1330 family)